MMPQAASHRACGAEAIGGPSALRPSRARPKTLFRIDRVWSFVTYGETIWLLFWCVGQHQKPPSLFTAMTKV